MDVVKERQEILSGYPELSRYTNTCIPTLRKLVNRRYDPLPSVRVSPRKIVFVTEDVLAWFSAEAERQTKGTS